MQFQSIEEQVFRYEEKAILKFPLIVIGKVLHLKQRLERKLRRIQQIISYDNLQRLAKQQFMELISIIQICFYVPLIEDSDIDKLCPICLSQLENGVSGQPCKHSFCSVCILTYWVSKNKTKLKCPFCRAELRKFSRLFQVRISSQRAIKETCKQLLQYNKRFGSRTIALLSQFSSLPQTVYSVALQTYDLFKFIKNLILVIILSFLILYIVSPIDLIPELYLGIFGLIDDLFALFMVAIIVSRYSILPR